MQKKTLSVWLSELNQEKIDLGLTRIKEVYQRLNLHRLAAKKLLIAGTNGKGSTVAVTSSIAQQAGYSVGSFTSPHLFKYNERICINDEPVTDAQIVHAFEEIEQACERISLSYFEYSTLAALLIFKIQKVDLIVLEVGLGGRLDATNVIEPDCSVITTIDLDHTAVLGDTREEIGREKAGILRADAQAIFADDDCPQSIKTYAEHLGTELHYFGQDYTVQENENGFDYAFKERVFKDLPQPNIRGMWQLKNSAAAITALHLMGLQITQRHIHKGLTSIQLKGRLETIQAHAPEVMLDVAHNAQSAKSLAQWLENNPIDGSTRVVFSALKDKGFEQWVGQLGPYVAHWFVAPIKDSSRSASRFNLMRGLSDQVGLISYFDQVADAYQTAIDCSEANDRVVVFGSFYLLAEVYEYLNKE